MRRCPFPEWVFLPSLRLEHLGFSPWGFPATSQKDQVPQDHFLAPSNKTIAPGSLWADASLTRGCLPRPLSSPGLHSAPRVRQGSWHPERAPSLSDRLLLGAASGSLNTARRAGRQGARAPLVLGLPPEPFRLCSPGEDGVPRSLWTPASSDTSRSGESWAVVPRAGCCSYLDHNQEDDGD